MQRQTKPNPSFGPFTKRATFLWRQKFHFLPVPRRAIVCRLFSFQFLTTYDDSVYCWDRGISWSVLFVGPRPSLPPFPNIYSWFYRSHVYQRYSHPKRRPVYSFQGWSVGPPPTWPVFQVECSREDDYSRYVQKHKKVPEEDVNHTFSINFQACPLGWKSQSRSWGTQVVSVHLAS